jgi:hypothetical protein
VPLHGCRRRRSTSHPPGTSPGAPPSRAGSIRSFVARHRSSRFTHVLTGGRMRGRIQVATTDVQLSTDCVRLGVDCFAGGFDRSAWDYARSRFTQMLRRALLRARVQVPTNDLRPGVDCSADGFERSTWDCGRSRFTQVLTGAHLRGPRTSARERRTGGHGRRPAECRLVCSKLQAAPILPRTSAANARVTYACHLGAPLPHFSLHTAPQPLGLARCFTLL